MQEPDLKSMQEPNTKELLSALFTFPPKQVEEVKEKTAASSQFPVHFTVKEATYPYYLITNGKSFLHRNLLGEVQETVAGRPQMEAPAGHIFIPEEGLPEADYSCDFFYVGCSVTLAKKDLEDSSGHAVCSGTQFLDLLCKSLQENLVVLVYRGPAELCYIRTVSELKDFYTSDQCNILGVEEIADYWR